MGNTLQPGGRRMAWEPRHLQQRPGQVTQPGQGPLGWKEVDGQLWEAAVWELTQWEREASRAKPRLREAQPLAPQ